MGGFCSTQRRHLNAIITHSDEELPLLIDGYIRNNAKMLNKPIPKALNNIFLKYYDCYKVYEGIFQKNNTGPNTDIVNDVRIEFENYRESRRCEISKLNKSILMDENHIYVWQISMKYIDGIHPDGIGVIADGSNDEFYGISMDDNRKYHGNRSFIKYKHKDKNQQNGFNFSYNNDDIITIEFDCILYELTFRLNNKEIIYGPLKLVKTRKEWFPAILFTPKSNKTQCKFIKYRYKNLLEINSKKYDEKCNKIWHISRVIGFNIFLFVALSMFSLNGDLFLTISVSLVMLQISMFV